MLWIKTLHLAALLTWCAALLGVIAGLVAQPAGRAPPAPTVDLPEAVMRTLFIQCATPAALLTIVAGTALFPWVPSTEGWLAGKLTVVTGLMGCHLVSGWALLRRAGGEAPPAVWLQALAGLALGAMLITLWLVLGRPG